MQSPSIIKANGDHQKFSPKKLNQSLLKCGLKASQAQDATQSIVKQLHQKKLLKPRSEAHSRDIFTLAHRHLNQMDRIFAYRYSLKRGLFELGPTGYPFEELIGRLYLKQGYRTQTSQHIKGKCVTHEVDVVAQNTQELIWVECKFHNEQNTVNDLKTALYIYARYLDLSENQKSSQIQRMCFATNTRFTLDAERFSLCRGVQLLGWDTPSGNAGHAGRGLNQLLEMYRLYPVTIIHDFTRRQKTELLRHGIITTEDFLNQKNILVKKMGLSEKKWSTLSQQLQLL